MSTIEQLIKNDKAHPFRVCEIKRRLTGGGYESSWFDISAYIKKWGTIKYDMEDEKINTFKLSGINMSARNDQGSFSPRDASSSLFNGFSTAYKTKFRLRAGYFDVDGTQVPTDNTIFLGVMTDEIELNGKNEAVFKVKSLNSIFEDVPATRIPVTGSQTASDIIGMMRDLTDGAGEYIFREFITAASWDIQTTTQIYYNLNTTTAMDGSCWKLLNNLCASENKAVWVDNAGDFHFKDKTTLTTTSQFEFSGVGVKNSVYGHSIISIDSFKEAFSKVYTRIRVKFAEADTETSFYTKEESWTIGDSSSSYAYGQRTYDVENFWLNTAGAQALGDQLFNDLKTLKKEVRLSSKFIPHLNTLDKVTVNYQSSAFQNDVSLWDNFMWNVGKWKGNSTIFSVVGDFGIRGMEIDLDGFKNKFFLRGI